MNTTLLLLGVLLSSIGLGYFIYGKKQRQPVSLISGISLMIIPYFFSNPYLLILAGVVLMFLPKYIDL